MKYAFDDRLSDGNKFHIFLKSSFAMLYNMQCMYIDII